MENIRIEKLTVPSTTITLNHCISSSGADIVVILDDDASPHFGWLESHTAAFTIDPDLAYTSGREVRSTQARSSFSDWVRIATESLFGLFIAENKKLHGRIVGWINGVGLIFGNFDQPGTCLINSPRACNMAVRKRIFLALGGFNEKFGGNAWGFEADFGLRAARKGCYGRYVGNAIVIHEEVRSGGSRERTKSGWFKDYVFNHRILIQNLGPQAWIGSVPRLLKKLFFS